MSLREELAAFAATMPARRPPEQLAIMEQTTRELIASGIGERALKEGDHAPDFALPDATGRIHALREVLERGPVILTFYRGGWCPVLQSGAARLSAPAARDQRAWRQPVSCVTPDAGPVALDRAEERTGISGAERCRPARRGALRHRIRAATGIAGAVRGVRQRAAGGQWRWHMAPADTSHLRHRARWPYRAGRPGSRLPAPARPRGGLGRPTLATHDARCGLIARMPSSSSATGWVPGRLCVGAGRANLLCSGTGRNTQRHDARRPDLYCAIWSPA